MRQWYLFGLTLGFSAMVLSMICVDGVEAQRARRGRRRGRAAAAETVVPESAAIAPALGELRWGMSPEDTFNQLSAEITESYAERLRSARNDSVLQDRLRNQIASDTRRLRSTFVRFGGERSGWDSSYIRDEFTHGNGESMMVWRDDATHSQRYYFFIHDRLWKVYQAFDSSVYPNATFAQFANAIQSRFGRGVNRSGVLVEGRDPTNWVEWQDATTRLRAVDQTQFYGFFCLVFEDKQTLSNLSRLRTHTQQQDSDRHAAVDSILRDGDAQPGGNTDLVDSNADIADRLSGHIRHRSTPAAQGNAPATASGSSSASTRPTSAPSTTSDDFDPLAGLDL